MDFRVLVLLLACLCMAVACREAHLDGSTTESFHESIRQMGGEHKVEEAQALGLMLADAEKRYGVDVVRKAMNGMSYAEAKAYLEQQTRAPVKG